MSGERGSAGVLITTGMCVALLVAFTFALTFVAWFSAARQAEQAAELAALAAVTASVAGDAPCPAAENSASRNGVAVHTCVVRGSGRHVVVEITVEAPLSPTLPGAPTTLRRSAAAGSGGA